MILFFHGADTFRSRQKLREVLQKFKRDVDPQGYNMAVLQGGICKPAEVIGALSQVPFLARKRLVLLEEASKMEMSVEAEESLVQATQAALSGEAVFVVWEAELGKAELKQPFFAALLASPYAMEFPALDASQVGAWMRQRLQAAGVELDAQAWGHVLLAVEDDLFRASSEADKLIAYAQAFGKTRLGLADLKPLVAGGLRDDVFSLVDAVSQAQPKQSLALLHDQLASGSHALELVGLLIRQYRLIQQVMDGLAEGLTPDRIAALYKMHPFVAKKMSGQSRRFQPAQVRAAYDILVRLDRDLKGSGLPPDLLMSAAVAKLAAVSA